MERSTIDVTINVYGKPQQTAVTLLSLLEHSGHRIGNIWFIEEYRQPFHAKFDAIKSHLGASLIHFRPSRYLGLTQLPWRWLHRLRPIRHALRYQYAWERTDSRFLFITHNDVRYKDDIVGAMLERIEGNIAVGPVGQCWNCPARIAQVCSPETFMDYRPSYAEWLKLAAMYPGARSERYPDVVDPRRPWPLPECRVNEWSMLVDLSVARAATMPVGPAMPLGAYYGMDIGTQWFNDILNAGHMVAHMDVRPYADHAWASTGGGGHAALSDEAEYRRGEAMAIEHLGRYYPAFKP